MHLTRKTENENSSIGLKPVNILRDEFMFQKSRIKQTEQEQQGGTEENPGNFQAIKRKRTRQYPPPPQNSP
jgi:hypothetical protein